MSSRINLRDGELGHSLSSWISNHLGGKSYITDDANQSPSSPLKGSSSGSPERARRFYPLARARCLYSLIPLSNSGWYYFKARPDKNLLRGSPSNVKGWKKRFFFALEDEWEFFLSMPPGVGIPSVTRSWGTPGKSCNMLPILTEGEAKRTAEVLGKIEPGGYFDVSKSWIPRPSRSLRPWLHGEQFTPDDLVTKSFHALGQSQEHQNDLDFQIARTNSAELKLIKAQNRALKVEGQLAELGEQAATIGAELKDKSEAVARLEAEVAELTSKLFQAKKLAIEEFKSSDDFKVAVTDSAATYFGKDFEFCKRQLLHQHPNLGINVASMEMDANFFEEEEEEAKESEKEMGNEGEANLTH
ncbi:hypothetical protein Acr_14g0005640 [Actinidia rufa]|uniref:Uncharacterized protein n=1 Tax=Actinidia rufa TaxID=165716 RepID=A0A7J0FQC9_9ERIC|nr:hypothetical protein Acr_14g0005640 [Actinidia rufa]